MSMRAHLSNRRVTLGERYWRWIYRDGPPRRPEHCDPRCVGHSVRQGSRCGSCWFEIQVAEIKYKEIAARYGWA